MICMDLYVLCVFYHFCVESGAYSISIVPGIYLKTPNLLSRFVELYQLKP